MQAWEKSARRIAIGSDHAGLKLKEAIKRQLGSQGIETIDVGTHTGDSVDYPDLAEKVARLVSTGKIPEGILVCGTGIGMSITANKYPGVRAAVAPTPFMAKMARAHNDANVLCIGARVVTQEQTEEILQAWLGEPFEGGRHQRRVDKMKALDRAIVPPGTDDEPESSA